MTALRLMAALAAAVGLAGCVVGPDYRAPPTPPGAVGPLLSARPVETTPAATPDDWWRLYSDPRLDGYVAEAFAANADLAAAEANLSAARAVLDASRAGLFPSTTTQTGAIRGRDPTTNEILEIVGEKPHTIWKYDALLDVSYELDLFGRVRRSIEAAGADAEAVAAARDNLKVTVAAETARAYAQICTSGEEIAVARHALDVVSRELQITIHRRDAGAGSDFDVVRSQLLVAQVRATIAPLEGRRRAALFQLGAVLGRTPANAPVEALACAKPPKLASLVPVGDGASLLKRRPDVRQADRRIAAATARIGVATADLYPRISLTGFWGGGAPTLADLPKNAGLIWGVGPMISWSFPNQLLPRARIRQARAGEAAALAGFDSVVLQALKEIEQALTAYSAELEHNRALGEAQEKARIGYELAHEQFLAGSTTQLDLLASEQQLVSAESAVASSDAAITQDQIGVFKALGGGWATPAAPAAELVPVSR